MAGDEVRDFAASIADRYRVEEELGRGGWGVVFAAHDFRHDRSVAIKLLRHEYTGSLSSERFRREIAILSRLDHPNIVSLYDSGEFAGVPWYAMSRVHGETLRTRLDRERQLPIAEAVRITRAIASALAHAHEAGVVHRDIKPANVLLNDDRVRVADFGVARALTNAVSSEHITSSGVQIGTPAYMSPEQAAGEPGVDSRSDIYSLGCVLYEMLAGAPPFAGVTGAAVVARQVLDPVPSLRTVRPGVPTSLERLVYKALAKSAADRFQSADAMLTALERAASEREVCSREDRRRRIRKRPWVFALGSGLLAVGAWSAWSAHARRIDAESLAVADTTRVLALPVEGSDAPAQAADDAVGRWTGVNASPVGRPANPGANTFDARRARDVALALHAGRFLRTIVSRDGDRIRARAQLFDVRDPQAPLWDASAIAESQRGVDDAVRRAVDASLLRTSDSAALSEGTSGTTSLAARQSVLRGLTALEAWHLARADSAFAQAATSDPSYARASLWLALTRNWSSRDSAAWAFAAEAASGHRDKLPEQERTIADALVLLARGDRPASCAAWAQMADANEFDFAAWYTAGDCLARDDVVVPDAKSVSGWRFRSGGHTALSRLRRAFVLRPAVLESLRDDQFERLRRRLWISSVDLRSGRKAGAAQREFGAYPSWDHDTLAFIPFPLVVFQASDNQNLRALPTTIGDASRHQRELLHDIATEWVTTNQHSTSAREALALSLCLLGNPAAIDTLQSAMSLARNSDEKRQLLVTEAWMRLDFGIPGDVRQLRRARTIADSLLGDSSGVPSRALASLAAIAGRISAADGIEQRVTLPRPTQPVALVTLERRLAIYAAFGGPADSTGMLAMHVDSVIDTQVPRTERAAARERVLTRPLTMLYPDSLPIHTPTASERSFYLLRADDRVSHGDLTGARRILDDVRASRQRAHIDDASLDVVWSEARLLAQLGAPRSAVEWLDPALARVRSSAPTTDVVRGAALVRAMATRADLAAYLGDKAGAETWARAVVELWQNGDAPLAPLVARMKTYIPGSTSSHHHAGV